MLVGRFKPRIDCPYPNAWERVHDFEYVSRLVLGRDPSAMRMGKNRETCYVLMKPYTVTYFVDEMPVRLTVPAGMLTDLTSVPRLLRGIIGRVGPHLEAAIVHDFLYVAWQLLPYRQATRRDWQFANEVMFAGLRAAGVSLAARAAIQAALRPSLLSWRVYRNRNDGPTDVGLFMDLNS